MILLRSLLFQLLFYAVNLGHMVFWLPVFFLMPRPVAWKVARVWARSLVWVVRHVAGLEVEFRGLENVPLGQPFLVASKHQSSLETFSCLLILPDPTYIIKRELMWLPLFGWYAAKMDLIPVNRGRRSEALKAMTRAAKAQYEALRQILIYPEGTRRMPGAPPDYKYGVANLYTELGARVLPVALNTGLYWPARGITVHPGRAVIEFLPVIEPGLDKATFAEVLQERIETATHALIAEAAADPTAPPRARSMASAAVREAREPA